MTLFSLVENRDTFVTRIETAPEYLLIGSRSLSIISGVHYFCGDALIRDSLYYRDRYNPSSSLHYYYYTTPDSIPTSQDLSASLVVYNSVASSEPRARVCKNLDSYYFLSMSDGSGSGFYGSQIDILSIPRAYYGKEFKNFVCVEQNLLNGIRTTWDDGKGNVYVCTDRCGDSPRLVGKAFYSEGILFVRTDPTLGLESTYAPWMDSDSFCIQVSFTGSYDIYTLNILAHIGEHVANFSSNETSWTTAANGEKVKLFSGSNDRTFISQINLYDEQMKCIGTAKVASPIRKLPSDRLCMKMRLDIA